MDTTPDTYAYQDAYYARCGATDTPSVTNGVEDVVLFIAPANTPPEQFMDQSGAWQFVMQGVVTTMFAADTSAHTLSVDCSRTVPALLIGQDAPGAFALLVTTQSGTPLAYITKAYLKFLSAGLTHQTASGMAQFEILGAGEDETDRDPFVPAIHFM